MNSNEGNSRRLNQILPVILTLCVIVGAIFFFVRNYGQDKKKTYSEIVALFYEDKIQSYTLNLSNGTLEYQLRKEAQAEESAKEKDAGRKTGKTDEARTYAYTVPDITLFYRDIHPYVLEYNEAHPASPVKYDYKPGSSNSWLITLLPMVATLAVLGVFMFIMMRRMNDSLMSENNRSISFGKARIRTGKENGKRVTFEDVAGADEEKEELAEIVEFLRNPARYSEIGARIPKGVLLVGPPGTGKTLLAKAVAGEADVPFLSISGSDFLEMYVGVGAARVRDLFAQAKKNSPSIVFIDEIDAVARHRGSGMGGGHDEREQTLNQMLVEMDGFVENDSVIVIAATNRPDILDPALLRPGRFDRQVTVGYPDIKGREAILKVHARNKSLAPDVDLAEIARSTVGFTGADLENLLNEAALLAAKRGLRSITKAEIKEATIKVVAGTEKKSRKVTEKEKSITAFHEAGHAVASYFLEGQDPVYQVSIIPRGRAAGFTLNIPEEDRDNYSRSYMLDKLVVLLGGRAAEKLVFDDITTGASNDIERASEMARDMVTKYGMSDALGPISFGAGEHEVFLGRDYGNLKNYSEEIARQIDEEVKRLVTGAYEKSLELLTLHRDRVDALAAYLIEHEKIEAEDFNKLMKGESDGALPAPDEITE